ncbi:MULTISPECIES: MarR family winged helix-turn-helix transcriptional regulator [Pseudonocardia]|uniref:Transcriptional regulator HosA n=2 Tax=Pseudonocardia TaxID=1847 RepID=A0A1Y2MLA6_PSEAH|nr:MULTISPECIES: MarR family transcriptional regulator [Pseudonocardia]OSY35821.1 Transcriptional regulator HosA [Pseudonocardia autotrophica]TDN73115.1 DNA-binding MarR family transcriptional regulator [Pseudonocardia autotrophica]BBG03834.1 transcriptional regulator [Pseudonocardia autotrophica]GEC27367.1 transcriptional regulator [Pseudonocardia saturnea]
MDQPSSDAPLLDTGPDAYTGFLIRRAQQAHVAAWQRQVSSEISSVQFGVLSTLAARPGASQRDLQDALDLDRSTIADLVGRLERHGLVERVRADEDRRRNVLHLTEQGRTAHETLRPRVDLVETTLTGRLTTAERDRLQELLRRVLA